MNRYLQKTVLDIMAWGFAGVLAFFIRVDLPFPEFTKQIFWYGTFGFIFKIILVTQFGLSRQTWHKVGIRDLYRLTVVVAGWMLLIYVLNFMVFAFTRVPRSIPLIEGAFTILFMGGLRLLTRVFYERESSKSHPEDSKRILIVGAGEAGTMIAREMLRHPENGLLPIGFLDDDVSKYRQSFVGLPVLGNLGNIAEVAERHGPHEVLIAMPSVSGKVIREIVNLSRTAKLKYRIIPGVFELLSGAVGISQIREVDVEDLLRRDPVHLNIEEISDYLQGKTVLVTGAGGSIGSEIVRQIARFRPNNIVLLGRGENSIYLIQQELRRSWPELVTDAYICDVRDASKLELAFSQFHPTIVFHAAAHKHVPLMELHPDEAIVNNVMGTKNVVNLCLRYKVQRLVNISSDKAVNPSSVMGASKRLAELVVDSAAAQAQPNQYFVSVRFGNVLGSRGSVIPLFREQIKQGGPVTITHEAMTRYFMTIPEAAQLVLQASGLEKNGVVYVLDMGEPVKIIDLARDLIRLSGFEIGKDMEIVVTGSRPGEKLFEEILTTEEGIDASRFKKIFVAKKQTVPESFVRQVLEIEKAALSHDGMLVRQLLREILPSYQDPNPKA